MPQTFQCAFCGSTQTWSGTGPRICQSCGATQVDQAGSASPGGTTTGGPAGAGASWRRLPRFMWLLLLALLIVTPVALVRHARTSASTAPEIPTVVWHSRILAVNNPPVRLLPAGADLSPIDLVHSSPANAAALLDTRSLTINNPRPMNDLDGKLWFVGEVTNHSPDHTAVAPTVQMSIVKNGRVAETSDLHFSDLPPGGHAPVYFGWDGEPSDVQNFAWTWKPVQAYAAGTPNHPKLEATITNRKLTPGTVMVNFTSTYRFVTADVEGTVTNTGDAVARDAQVILTLRDARGHVTGFKAKELNPIAPGEQVNYSVEADQWGDPVASLNVEALVTTTDTL